MSGDLIVSTVVMLRGLTARARVGIAQRAQGSDREGGVSTLEMVIIALGLMAVATVLVAAITIAVTRRTDQIK